MGRRMFDFVDQLRFYPVQHSGQDGTRRSPVDAKDRDRDQQADDGIGQRKPGPAAECPRNNREADEAVGAGMVAIRDQCCRVDLPSDPDAKNRNRFVAGEAHESGDDHSADVGDRTRVDQPVDQPVDRLLARHYGAEEDDEDDDDPGKILDPTKTIVEATGGGTTREREGEPERQGSCGTREVVDRIGEEGNSA